MSDDLSDCLNLNQSPGELADLYGPQDYYWYLRSPAFQTAFLQPMGESLSGLGSILDVGCGEGQLADHVPGAEYVGLEGSARAVRRARIKRPKADVRLGRIEQPGLCFPPEARFNVLVFGGVLEVLVRPEKRVGFLDAYRQRFGAKFVLIYDLLRLDTAPLDSLFAFQGGFEASADLEGIPDVKRHRKVRLYQC